MALYRCGMGGGAKVKQGTLTTSAASTDYTINTGLSSIKELWIHGYGSGSSGYTMQHLIYYTEDDSTNYQVGCHLMPESNVGCAGRSAIGTALNRRGYTLKSINGGTVTITTPTVNATFASCNLNWTAIG